MNPGTDIEPAQAIGFAAAAQNRSAGADWTTGAVRHVYDLLDPVGDALPVPSDRVRALTAAGILALPELGILPLAADVEGAVSLADDIIGRAMLLLERAPERNPKGKPSRFAFARLSEVLSLPPLEYLVPGLLVRGGSSVLAAFTGHAKTFLATDVALSIAFALLWRGELAVLHGSVAYIAAEGFVGLGQRVRAWLDYHKLESGKDAPLFFLRAAPQLINAGDVRALVDSLKALPAPLVLVVIDTLSRTFVGGNENDGEDVGKYVAAVELIQRETGAHVCVIHHAGWNSERERGHTALRAAVDTLLFATREDNRVTLSVLKQKDGEPYPDLHFDLRPWGDSAVLVPQTDDQRKKRPAVVPQTRQKALDALKRGGEAGGLSFTKWCDSSGLARATFTRCVNDLESWGLIEKRGGKWVSL